MNNGLPPNCSNFAWVTDSTTVISTSPAWIQLTWPSAVTIGSFYIVTENGLSPTICPTPLGRNIASGTVQTWNGAIWVTAGSFSGQNANVQFNLPSQVTTTQIRVTNMTTDPGNGNSIIYQWHVYSAQSCMPPP
jgi:hypothetical protein